MASALRRLVRGSPSALPAKGPQLPTIRDPQLLEAALTHSRDGEKASAIRHAFLRLALLGDSVFNFYGIEV
jgi:hypothetical protein